MGLFFNEFAFHFIFIGRFLPVYRSLYTRVSITYIGGLFYVYMCLFSVYMGLFLMNIRLFFMYMRVYIYGSLLHMYGSLYTRVSLHI